MFIQKKALDKYQLKCYYVFVNKRLTKGVTVMEEVLSLIQMILDTIAKYISLIFGKEEE